MQPAQVVMLVLLCSLLAAVVGFAGGYGGRLAALWSIRTEVSALAGLIDPKTRELAGQAHALAAEVALKIDTIDRTVKSVAGQFGAMKRSEKISSEDLDFIVATVQARLGAGRAIASVPR